MVDSGSSPGKTSVVQGKSRIFIECTQTYASNKNSGIQRVVRNIIRSAPNTSISASRDIIPVVLTPRGFAAVSYDGCFQGALLRKKKTRLPQKILRELVRAVNRITRRFGSNPYRGGTLASDVLWLLDQASSFEGDVLVLLDATWWQPALWREVDAFRRKNGKVVGVLYDLIPIQYPQFYNAELVHAFWIWANNLPAHCDGIITISETVRAEALDYFGDKLSGNQIASFNLGAELDIVNSPPRVRTFLTELIEGPQLVFVMIGSIEPRKNHAYALDAFKMLWDGGFAGHLLIVGREGWRNRDLINRIERQVINGLPLHLLRDVSDDELDYLYRTADSLVCPSITEGFGLPIVEAFRRGLPVLCSDIPVFHEVAGDNAKYFSLDDPSTLTKLIVTTTKRSAATPKSKGEGNWLTWNESAAQLLDRAIKVLGMNVEHDKPRA
jgi:glycosyltransferase involved in cell wall biosynthesis